MITEPSHQLIKEELSRLDGMWTELHAKARKGDLGAIDRALKIMDRRSRYLGLDYDARQRDDHSDVDLWMGYMLGRSD